MPLYTLEYEDLDWHEMDDFDNEEKARRSFERLKKETAPSPYPIRLTCFKVIEEFIPDV